MGFVVGNSSDRMKPEVKIRKFEREATKRATWRWCKCHAQYLCLLCLRQKAMLRCEAVAVIPSTQLQIGTQSTKIHICGNNKAASTASPKCKHCENGVMRVSVCVRVCSSFSLRLSSGAAKENLVVVFLRLAKIEWLGLAVSHFAAAFFLAHSFSFAMKILLKSEFAGGCAACHWQQWCCRRLDSLYPSGNVCPTKNYIWIHAHTFAAKHCTPRHLFILFSCRCVCTSFYAVCACIQLCSAERKQQHTLTHRQGIFPVWIYRFSFI